MNSRIVASLFSCCMLIYLLFPVSLTAVHAAGVDCNGLLKLKLPNGKVTSAGIVADGKFTIPGTDMVLEDLPSFCRVAATVEPAIRFEVWMPVTDWNGKFNGVGLMGYIGAINYNDLAPPLRRGYAAASTDGGHSSGPTETEWAIGHPQAIDSLGRRAHHEMTVAAKASMRAYYGADPHYSYFTGCSAGGWQGLTEAQRYPDDYDGIVSGGPVFNLIHLHAGSLWNAMQVKTVKQEKIDLLYQAVLNACDARDGVTDAMIEDPRTCNFDPASMACSTEDDRACLTTAEIASFRNITRGLRYSTGGQIYPGWPLSAMGGLGAWKNPGFINLAAGTFKNLAFQGDPDWHVEHMDYDVDVPRADNLLGPHLISNDPDLRKFKQHGGKLLLYHGWNDPVVSVNATIDYYLQVAAAVTMTGAAGPEQIQNFSRLFLAPGMGHCRRFPGPGPYRLDALGVMDRWVESGEAPDKLIVSNPDTGVSRYLCPYPQVAQYNGTGNTNEAGSFECAIPNQ